jgi:predicted permease
MAMRSEWMNRLRYLVRRSRFEDDLDDEIRFHIESRAAELQVSGLSSRDALARARREFGPVARSAEDSRAAWQCRWFDDLTSDLRYALRSFLRRPAFTLTAVLSLALGIGANSAIFTALDAVLWKPLPVTDPQSLVYLSILRANGRNADPPGALIRQLRQATVFTDLITTGGDGLSFSYDDRAERIVGEFVSPNFFTFLGVKPMLGQAFTPDVEAGRWAPQAVLSYNFWRRRFGGDPRVIGRTIRLNTYPFTIVGVSPPSFFGLTRGSDYEMRIPILPDGQELAQIHEIGGSWRGRTTIARLKPDESILRAEAAADGQLQEFLRTTPDQRFRNTDFRHLRLRAGDRGDSGDLTRFHAPLYVLLALVAIVLLIACTNVANMLMARGAARARELALRASIGAGRLRLIRQMLTESVLLSLIGGACGIAVAHWTAGLLLGFLPQGHMSIALDLHPDIRALLFTSALSLLTGILFGLTPALHSTHGDLAATLKSDSASSLGERRSAGFRKVLIVSQVAFSLVLLIAAGIFVRTLSGLRPADYRANPKRVLLFTMKPQREIYSDDRKRLLAAELVRRVREMPGVQAAALAENGPLGSRGASASIEAPGHEPVRADLDWISAGFFDTIGVPRIAGRDFHAADKPGAPGVVIVNESLARAFFKNESPIGRAILFSPGRKGRRAFEIVGVVVDTHYYDVHKEPGPTAWFTFQDDAPAPYMPTLHVRTATSETSAVIAGIRRAFDLVDKGFPVFNIKTLEVRMEESLSRERMVANISTAFGVLALALAAVGLYGILAYSVSRRTREIGLRMALGSGPGRILWMVAREALVLVGIGSVAGLTLAIGASRVLSRYLVGASGPGPAILIVCVASMLAMAALAISIPALRACRVDPLDALRHD